MVIYKDFLRVGDGASTSVEKISAQSLSFLIWSLKERLSRRQASMMMAKNFKKAMQPEPDVQDEDSDEEVALDAEDLENVVLDDDAVPKQKQKVEIENTDALRRIRETIQLDPSLPWTETLVVPFPETIDVDVDDDLNRELAFYKQALHAVDRARELAASHSLSFTRPSDYFAEMVKSDAHMERIRSRLLDERAGIKKAEDKRKERAAKKFGKQVQLEKQREREKGKKEMGEQLKSLKRKRKGALDNQDDNGEAFDIAVEDAISDRPAGKRPKSRAGDSKRGGPPKGKHMAGGKQAAGGKRTGGSKRPGKSKRIAARSRR
ncbi:eukaryotic rRNA processing protein EBP2-domain-containing protein [Chiua virens]|nr:eukaryotic rRNA processing protein EBP2-domain-containing protein [Chiua virens]